MDKDEITVAEEDFYLELLESIARDVKQRITIVLVVALLMMAGAWCAFQMFKARAVPTLTSEPCPECEEKKQLAPKEDDHG